jgi:hypothetical protein
MVPSARESFHSSDPTSSSSATSSSTYLPPQRPQRRKSFLKSKKSEIESLDFEDCQSRMYRKHETRRFYQDEGKYWNKSRLITLWKWIYVVIIGILVGVAGSIVTKLIDVLIKWKLEVGK